MFKKNSKILILSPHTDDGELGCGGSISRLLCEGHEVFYAAFSTAETSVPDGYPKNILETDKINSAELLNGLTIELRAIGKQINNSNKSK